MNSFDKLDHGKIIEVAQSMGYDPGKPAEFNKYVNIIAKMDHWDISKILFFGNKDANKSNQKLNEVDEACS